MDNSTLKAVLFVSSGLSPIDAEKMRQAACLIEQLESDLEGVRLINKLQAEALAEERALNRAYVDQLKVLRETLGFAADGEGKPTGLANNTGAK